jgi:xanthine dehydrogenase YagT iron-sulfur-binding subunit
MRGTSTTSTHEDSTVIDISVTLNGTTRSLSCEPWVTLLDLLRERVHLTGTKKGCNHGACGACTVLVDGRRVLSCLTLAVTCDQRRIITIEGLKSGDSLHPMQEAFARHDALQCGYCTPGQIISAVGMLAEAEAGMPSAASNVTVPFAGRGALTEAEVRERLSGNICRCAAYQNIVAAVQDVASAHDPVKSAETLQSSQTALVTV